MNSFKLWPAHNSVVNGSLVTYRPSCVYYPSGRHVPSKPADNHYLSPDIEWRNRLTAKTVGNDADDKAQVCQVPQCNSHMYIHSHQKIAQVQEYLCRLNKCTVKHTKGTRR